MDTVQRRLELLKLEGLGFSQAEIVKHISQKMGCSTRTVYLDFETRSSWQPNLQSLTQTSDVLLKAVNRYEQVYRQASQKYVNSRNELVQLGALNVMLKANSSIVEVAVLPDLLSRLKTLEDKAKRGVFVP